MTKTPILPTPEELDAQMAAPRHAKWQAPFRYANRHARTRPVGMFWGALIGGIVLGLMSNSSSVSTAERRADKADARAKSAYAQAKADVEKDFESARADIEAAQSKLAAREAKVGAKEKAAKANEFEGSGTFLVGTDIKPGLYRAEASPGCYWERKADLNEGIDSIAANENVDGPAVIKVLPSDAAVEVSGCGTFRKIG